MHRGTGPVLIVMPVLGSGGVSRRVLEYVRVLRARMPVEVVVFEWQPFLRDEWPPEVSIRCLSKRGWWDVAGLIVRLRRRIGALRPRVVFSLIWYANLITLLAAVFLFPPPRVVISATMNTRAFLTGVRAGWLKRLAISLLYRRADSVVAVSKGVGRQLMDQFGVPRSRVRVVYNGIQAERLKAQITNPVAWPWPDVDPPTVLAVGRLNPEKNYPLLLEAFARVRDQMRARLVVLGEGPERAMLERLSARLGLEADVAFPGFDLHPAAWMARSTILALSSTWEGQPNVLLEAMACGVPVISTRCPFGPDEIIEPEITGLLVPCNDIPALAQGMLRLLQDEDLRCRLAQRARRELGRLSYSRMVKGLGTALGLNPARD